MRDTTITIRLSSATIKNIDEAASLTGVTRSHLAAAILTVSVHNMKARAKENDLISFLKKYQQENGGNINIDQALAVFKKQQRSDGVLLYDGYTKAVIEHGFNIPEWMEDK
jgi:hypothetical protein